MSVADWTLPIFSKTPHVQKAMNKKQSIILSCRYGRVWHIHPDTHKASTTRSSGSTAPTPDTLVDMITSYAPRPQFKAAGTTFNCKLEALLIGHEDWLHSICWQPVLPTSALAASDSAMNETGTSGTPSVPALHRSELCLLSSSQDRSMILWRFDSGSGLWMNEASVGDAGATCLGYYGGVFSPDGTEILAHGFTGALHLWKWQSADHHLNNTRQQQQQQQQQQPDAVDGQHAGNGVVVATSRASGIGGWVPQHATGGHFGAVVDVCWGVDGRCLQSVSTDQTARLFTSIRGHWCEVARTQVRPFDGD